MVGEQLLSGACELLAVMVTIAQPKKREANPACTEPLAPPKNRQQNVKSFEWMTMLF